MMDLESAVAEEDGDVSPEALELSIGRIEWGKIHHSPPDAAASPPPRPPWPMVSIRKHHDRSNTTPPIIFPPVDHENLQIFSNPYSDNASITLPIHIRENSDSASDSDLESVTNSNSSSSFSPSESSPVAQSPFFSRPKSTPVANPTRWFSLWTEMLYFKVNSISRYLWASLVFTSFRSAALTALLVLFLYLRRRRRLGVGEESRARLIGIIKERDQRIKQLLDKISGMNQVLLAHHKLSTRPST